VQSKLDSRSVRETITREQFDATIDTNVGKSSPPNNDSPNKRNSTSSTPTGNSGAKRSIVPERKVIQRERGSSFKSSVLPTNKGSEHAALLGNLQAKKKDSTFDHSANNLLGNINSGVRGRGSVTSGSADSPNNNNSNTNHEETEARMNNIEKKLDMLMQMMMDNAKK